MSYTGKEIRADLHMHSTASDGLLSPEALAVQCHTSGLNLMAVTDHDTFAGSDRLLAGEIPLQLIPGVEMSMRDLHGLHLLGYGFTPAQELHDVVQQMANNRKSRGRLMVERLAELGMPLDWMVLQQQCGGSVGRPHIGRAMVEAGYVATLQEAFDRYIGQHGPAYVAGERLSIREAIPLMRRNGFVPVLAHPRELRLQDQHLVSLLEEWKALGLMGMEVYHPSAYAGGFAALDHMARRMGLLVTGGSDFHQQGDHHGAIGCMMDHWRSCIEDCGQLLDTLQAEQARFKH